MVGRYVDNFIGSTPVLKMNWANAFKQIRIHHSQLPYFAFDFDGHIFISLVIDFCRSDALREFSKFSKSMVLMTINTHPELFTKKVDPFKGTHSNFPHIMEYLDSWFDYDDVNLTRYTNGDHIYVIDVMVDDQWFGIFSNGMNISQHEAFSLKE